MKAPEALKDNWSEVKEHFAKLKPKQQDFLIAWIDARGCNSEAYRQAYNPQATTKEASAHGARIIANRSMQEIIKIFNESAESDLFQCKKAYHDGLEANKPTFSKDGEMVMEVEDHPTRIKAADSLTRLNGQIIQKTNVDVKHNASDEFAELVQGFKSGNKS